MTFPEAFEVLGHLHRFVPAPGQQVDTNSPSRLADSGVTCLAKHLLQAT